MRGIPTPEREEHSDYDDDIDGVPCEYKLEPMQSLKVCNNDILFKWMKTSME
jgi:hypothetical protein